MGVSGAARGRAGVAGGGGKDARGTERRGPGRTHLHAELVALEELPAGVAGAVALEELLGEPAVEALVVLALELGARLAHAVHRGGRAGRAAP